MKKQTAAERNAEVSDCKTLQELQALGEKRGYKPGWSVHVWDSRAGFRDTEDRDD